MTEDLIKKLKDVKQALVSKDMPGEEWEEREEILEKLEAFFRLQICIAQHFFNLRAFHME